MIHVWDISDNPILFVVNDNGENYFQQYGCVACYHYEFTGEILKIYDNLEKRFFSTVFHCNPVEYKLLLFLREDSGFDFKDISMFSCSEALVLFSATLNGIRQNFVLTWENCD